MSDLLQTLLAATARDLELRFAICEARAQAALTAMWAGAGAIGWQGPAADAYRRQLDGVAEQVAAGVEAIRANREVAAWLAHTLG